MVGIVLNIIDNETLNVLNENYKILEIKGDKNTIDDIKNIYDDNEYGSVSIKYNNENQLIEKIDIER